MSDFVSPISGKEFEEISSSKGIIRTDSYDNAVSPYKGTVKIGDDSSSVEITHNYNNKTYTTKFGNLNKVKVRDGQRVGTGESIGTTKRGKTEFSISDTYGLDVTKNLYKTDKSEKRPQINVSKGLDRRTIKNVLTPEKPEIDVTDRDEVKQYITPSKPEVDMTDRDFIKGALTPKPSPLSNLREDIQRIKNLMK